MNDLAEAARALVSQDRRSSALLVQQPDGDYHVSPNGYGDDNDNVYAISRAQISDLLRPEGIHADSLADPVTAERLATVVAEFRRQRLGPS